MIFQQGELKYRAAGVQSLGTLKAELDKLIEMDSVIDKMIKTASDGGYTHLKKEQLAALLMDNKPKKASGAKARKVNFVDDDFVVWNRESQKGNWTKKDKERFAKRAKENQDNWTDDQKNRYRQSYMNKYGG